MPNNGLQHVVAQQRLVPMAATEQLVHAALLAGELPVNLQHSMAAQSSASCGALFTSAAHRHLQPLSSAQPFQPMAPPSSFAVAALSNKLDPEQLLQAANGTLDSSGLLPCDTVAMPAPEPPGLPLFQDVLGHSAIVPDAVPAPLGSNVASMQGQAHIDPAAEVDGVDGMPEDNKS